MVFIPNSGITMDLEVAILLEEYKINLKIIMKKSEKKKKKKKKIFFLKNLYSLFYIFISGYRAKKFNY